MYFVVFCDDWCCTVPVSWVVFEKSIFRYPRKNAALEARKYSQPKGIWTTHQYKKIIGPCDSYEAGRRLEVATANVSTNDEDGFIQVVENSSAPLPHKRPIRIPEKYDSSSGVDESEDISPPSKKARVADGFFLNINSNYVPSNNTGEAVTEAATDDTMRNLEVESEDYIYDFLQGCDIDASPVALNARSIGVIERHDLEEAGPSTAKHLPTIRSVSKTNISLQTIGGFQSLDDSKNVHSNCCKACFELLTELNSNIKTNLKTNAEILLRLRDLSAPTPDPSAAAAVKQNLLPSLPVTTLEEIKSLEEILLDNTAHMQYKQMIKGIGGKDARHHFRNVLPGILSDELATHLTWTGQKNTMAVKSMRCIDILIEAVREVQKQSSIFDCANIVQKWLQRAGDRLRYAQKRQNGQ